MGGFKMTEQQKVAIEVTNKALFHETFVSNYDWSCFVWMIFNYGREYERLEWAEDHLNYKPSKRI